MADRKKIVVLGGSGFLGSHVADALTASGYDVTIFDVKPSLYLKDSQRFVQGDILDEVALATAMHGASAVYHYAGVADLKEAAADPEKTMTFNLLGTIKVLKACKTAQVKRLVFASSVYVYSNRGSYYRISKLASELSIEEFSEKEGLEYTILRYGSLYGSRTDMRNGIYRFVSQAVKDGRIVYKGTKDDRREYIHVDEAAKMSVDILSEEYRNTHLILTGLQALTSHQLLTMINEMLGGGIEIVIEAPESFVNYSVTPYSFTPKVGKKLVPNQFTDIGDGILRIIEEVHHEKQQTYDKASPL